ncbi:MULTISPECIES: ABC transporter permease subunit [Clostridia]|jgi:ribose/xylose/arabinose/galactoside ABC-type transport system permease subunit|uniref:ABC transporter permease n=1 Tax=Lacrimispora celerecrescens TaxID=29354 RepID=A0A084JJ58_9FIRM|nr:MULTISPECIES: ABC transporter permease [Clostridia]KEZ88992.1 ABC transporter permease [Lacrimispora celerecrescens]MBW4844024.1 sugar ABC transporter permease YjfF [Lachnospiraceae bacterium]MSS11673.1 sugar ABC transporter permease YjfF [Clostridium sp. WB02_MRS01]
MKNRGKTDGKIFLLMITIALFVTMYIAGIIIFNSKGFAKPQVFLNLFISNAGLIVIAAGMTMVMITGGIDISVGSVVALTCMMLAWMMEVKGIGAVPALLTVLVIGIFFGLVQGFFIAYLKIQPFIVTLAGMFFARGMTAIISQEMISVKNELFLKWAKSKINLTFLGGTVNKKGVVNYPFLYPSVIIALVVLVLVFVALKYTKFGRTIYAVGGNEQSALMMGLNVKRTKLLVYVINGFLCALGGFLFCLNTCAGFVEQAKGFEMEAIASAVIGGTLLSGGVGNVFGSLFGVLIKGTIETFITFQGTLSSWWTKITIAALLAFFILLQSLFAKAKEK